MSSTSIIFFYISTFFIAFLMCIPIGPVNLEIFHNAVKKHYPQAISTAIGASFGDSVWALLAFLGMSPFIAHNRYTEAAFLTFAAVITFILGVVALKETKYIEKKEKELVTKIKRKKKRWAILKGLTIVLINPLPIISWMIALSILRKFNIYIPSKLNYETIFLIVVTAGSFSYFFLIIFITNRMKKFFNHTRTTKIIKVLGYLFIGFSFYFLYYAIKLFFFNGTLISPDKINLP